MLACWLPATFSLRMEEADAIPATASNTHARQACVHAVRQQQARLRAPGSEIRPKTRRSVVRKEIIGRKYLSPVQPPNARFHSPEVGPSLVGGDRRGAGLQFDGIRCHHANKRFAQCFLLNFDVVRRCSPRQCQAPDGNRDTCVFRTLATRHKVTSRLVDVAAWNRSLSLEASASLPIDGLYSSRWSAATTTRRRQDRLAMR
jgi:hypothetical protein